MPAYQTQPTPFGETSTRILLPGDPGYAYGSFTTRQQATKMVVTTTALATNVATIGVNVRDGNIPAVGSLITVVNTSNASGACNATDATISAVNIVAATGIGTVSYNAGAGSLVTTADSGMAYVQVPEVAEALVVGKSRAFAIQPNLAGGGSYGFSWAYTCPSAPSTIAIQLEGAINDNDAEYTLIGTSQITTTGYNEIIATAPALVNFVRLHVTATTGGSSPTIIAKILKS